MGDKCKLASEVDVKNLKGSLVFDCYSPLLTGTIQNTDPDKNQALVRWENGSFDVKEFDNLCVIKENVKVSGI